MRDTIVVLSEPKVVGDATDRGIFSSHCIACHKLLPFLALCSDSRFGRTAALCRKLRSGEADAASASVFAFVWCLEEEEEEVVDERWSSYIT